MCTFEFHFVLDQDHGINGYVVLKFFVASKVQHCHLVNALESSQADNTLMNCCKSGDICLLRKSGFPTISSFTKSSQVNEMQPHELVVHDKDVLGS